MDSALEARLKATFPKLYRNSAYCACHDGWFCLIWRLSTQLEELISQVPEPEQEAYFAMQVKEKWGQLRFDLSTETDEMFQATEAALEESEQVCELCGAAGTLLNDGGWFMTRCSMHAPAPSQPRPAGAL